MGVCRICGEYAENNWICPDCEYAYLGDTPVEIPPEPLAHYGNLVELAEFEDAGMIIRGMI